MIGYMAEIVARRESIVARMSPAAKHAHFPQLYPRPAPSNTSFRITVNCSTGERTIETILPPPRIVRRPPPKPVLMDDSRETALKVLEATRKMVEQIWNVGRDELMSRSTRTRDGERYAVYRLLRIVNGWALSKIGRFVDRDHSTIMHGLKRARDFYEKGEQAWRDKFDEAARQLTAIRKGVDLPPKMAPRIALICHPDGTRLCRCCNQPILRLSTAARFCTTRCKKRWHSRKRRADYRAGA